jgi:hypothetical protein
MAQQTFVRGIFRRPGKKSRRPWGDFQRVVFASRIRPTSA